MTTSNKVEIEIGAVNTASPAINRVSGDIAAIDPAAQKAGASADAALEGIGKGSARAAPGVKSISEELAFVKNAFIALQAVSSLQAMVADVAKTADAYNNLQARIKLVTGEGTAFTTAFEGIKAVAQSTSTSLQATGDLFTKLAESGKQMGVGQAEALKLTQTVNQAVQLSGASAQASDAAVTQLIQGLQGGVLRGDEFNSVMEQAPRLSQAMADGLGVTTGQLRKMAEDGKLTSDVVINALKAQSDTVSSEFAKLPPTVGRALTQLGNSWTLYVGETDKASGASTAAASAIQSLAANLSTISGYLIDAGQAALAYTGYRLADNFLSSAAAAKTTAAAVATSTAATAANTAALAVNKIERDALGMVINRLPPALKGNAAALTEMGTALAATSTRYGDNKTQMAALGAELAATTTKTATAAAETGLLSKAFTSAGNMAGSAFALAGTAVKGFASLLGGIPGIALLILSNFKDIGTWMGEFVARHTAAGKQLQANEAALAAMEEKAKAATQARIKVQDELNAASAKAIKTQADAHRAAQDYIPVVEKIVKVTEAEAAAAIAMVKISGDEAAIRKVSADQGLLVAAARDKEAAAASTLVAAIEAQIAAIKKQESAQTPLTALQKDQIKDLEKLLIDKQLDAEKSSASAAAARTEAAARVALSDAYQDNSAKVEQYAQALEDARAKLDIIGKSGVATLDQIKAAQLEVNAASAKYNDALGDTVTQLQAKQIADKAAASATEIGLNAQKSYYKAMEDGAKAAGDYGLALYANIEQKKIDIALINAKVQAMKAEADGTIAVAKAELAVLDASGKVDPVKRAQIEASITLAEAKKGEAEAMGLSTKGIELQINALRNGTQQLDGFKKSTDSAAGSQTGFASAADAATAALERQNATRERAIAAKEKENELTQRAIDLENKRRNVDKDGFSTDKDGKRINAGSDLTTRTGILKFLQSAGVTDEAAARRLTNEFTDNQGNIAYMGNEGQKKYGGSTISDALLKAAESWTFSPAGIAASAAKTSTSTPPTALQTTSALQTATQTGQPSPSTQTQSASTSHTVTVNLAGIGNTTINTASAGDATNLSGLIQQLARAKTTSGL